ncbi:MAG: aldehyde dehydrogenase family protein, partial [Octadecabacter sp.]
MDNAGNFYINGQWVAPMDGRNFDVIDPSTEEATAVISLGGQADTDAAVAAAKAAFPTWRMTSKADRLDLLQRVLDVYQRRSDEIGAAISREMGAPIEMAKSQQSGAGSYHIGAFIDAFKDFEFEAPLRADDQDTRIIHEPIGVCALITPWNWPMNQIVLKVIPALASGCTMVLKPSEQSPLSAILFTEILDEAG